MLTEAEAWLWIAKRWARRIHDRRWRDDDDVYDDGLCLSIRVVKAISYETAESMRARLKDFNPKDGDPLTNYGYWWPLGDIESRVTTACFLAAMAEVQHG